MPLGIAPPPSSTPSPMPSHKPANSVSCSHRRNEGMIEGATLRNPLIFYSGVRHRNFGDVIDDSSFAVAHAEAAGNGGGTEHDAQRKRGNQSAGLLVTH